MTFGLTPEGFNRKRLADVKADEENSLIGEFGEINVQPQSIFGQFVGVMSKQFADLWEELEDVYFSQYPGTAEGVALDYVVALNGITRIPASRTAVTCVCKGDESTLINQGSLVRQPTTSELFFAEEDTLITQDLLSVALCSVDALASQSYNALINSISHIYSLPKIEFEDLFVTSNSIVVSINGLELSAVPFNTDSATTISDLATAIAGNASVSTATARLGLVINFDADFTSGDSIVVTINGSPLSAVPFNTDQANTIADLATAIQADANVTTCTVTDSREITIVPVDEGTFLVNSIVTTGGAEPDPISQRIDVVAVSGETVNIDYISITGGASQTAYSVSNLTPASINSVVSGLVVIINNSSEPVTATDNADGTFDVDADDSAVPYSLSLSTGMTIQEISSPVTFLADNFGEVSAPIATLTEILTPINGWDSVTNLKTGVTGRVIETDAELRLRRQNSVGILGAGTVEAIRSRILQEVSNVTECLVFENKTMTEENIIVVFDIDFTTGNQIIISINSVPLSTVNYSASHLNTMQLIKTVLEGEAGITTATIGGTGNRTLTIEMTQGFEIEITDIQITGTVPNPVATISGGRFPKSFEAVVLGGTDEDIANKIWQTKPAGIQTFGNTSYTITDSMDIDHAIRFSRPTPIYIWVEVDLTLYTEETFPSNGTTLVRQSIIDYGDSLSVGDDVLFQRVLCQIFEVDGVASGALQIASTLSPIDSPVFGTSDITIADNQVAIFSISRTSAVVV